MKKIDLISLSYELYSLIDSVINIGIGSTSLVVTMQVNALAGEQRLKVRGDAVNFI